MKLIIVFLIWNLQVFPQGSAAYKFLEKLTPTEQLSYSTIRIEKHNKDNTIESGTGFFFTFIEDSSISFPIIVTNRHIAINGDYGVLYFKEANKLGLPEDKKKLKVKVSNFENNFMYHPDLSIDLAILPLGPILHYLAGIKRNIFFLPLTKDLIPDSAEIRDLSVMEDIVFIGYPDNIWDQVNNFPIYRLGVTATHPAIDFNGNPTFLIDAACFPGSSGSPVFQIHRGAYYDRNRTLLASNRILLLGILSAVWKHPVTGEITGNHKFLDINTSVTSFIPNDLGIVVKSDDILDFENILKKRPGDNFFMPLEIIK